MQISFASAQESSVPKSTEKQTESMEYETKEVLEQHTHLILVIVQILTSNSTKTVSLLFGIHIMSSFIFFMLILFIVCHFEYNGKMHREVHNCSRGVSIKNYEP